ncbi:MULTISPECIES: TenA family transcriptional regulator [unclassified Colwellia]|uniref:TenA family transcriptional regulator n=1 Tax=unclassified Colwellia TaxID=196834 RepID=UPI001C712818|nr:MULTISPECIES: iron-containing redox enzyme family protein [unclassified Colwellia]
MNSHLTVDHPILAELMKEQENWPLLTDITLQGYQLTKNFLEYIENIFFHCPMPKHKRRLLHNMYEEETGRLSNTKNHVELMQDFIRAIGITDEERDQAVARAETKELIDFRMEAVKSPSRYHIGAAAVLIASEGQNLEERAGEARHSILGKFYGIEEKDLLFFSVHQKEDVGHVRQGIELVVDLCISAEMQAEALETVHHTCRLFYGMYEGTAKHYYAQKTA